MIRSISLVAKLRLGLFAVLFGLPSIEQVAASTPTPIVGDDINRLIVETMFAKGMVVSPRLSKSRKFLACQNGMSVKPMFGTWKTVKVSCNDKGGWAVMVRTNLKTSANQAKNKRRASDAPKISSIDYAENDVTAKTILKAKKVQKSTETMNILALSRSMSRGDVIMPRDIITISVPINAASGVFYNPDDIVGRKLKASVTAKKPIQARHLKPKWLVEEDDDVVIQNRVGGISVDMVGLALENGQYGEWIRVQNVSSGIIVVGQIKNKKIISTNAKITTERVVE